MTNSPPPDVYKPEKGYAAGGVPRVAGEFSGVKRMGHESEQTPEARPEGRTVCESAKRTAEATRGGGVVSGHAVGVRGAARGRRQTARAAAIQLAIRDRKVAKARAMLCGIGAAGGRGLATES